MTDIIKTVNNIIRQNINGLEVTEELMHDIPFADIGLTSFGLMRSLLLIEKELGVRVVTPKTIRSLKTVADLHALFCA